MLDQIGTAPSIFPDKYVHSKWNSADVVSTALNSDAVETSINYCPFDVQLCHTCNQESNLQSLNFPEHMLSASLYKTVHLVVILCNMM